MRYILNVLFESSAMCIARAGSIPAAPIVLFFCFFFLLSSLGKMNKTKQTPVVRRGVGIYWDEDVFLHVVTGDELGDTPNPQPAIVVAMMS